MRPSRPSSASSIGKFLLSREWRTTPWSAGGKGRYERRMPIFPIRAWTCLSPIARIVPIARASASASEGSAAPPMISAFSCENSRYRPLCGSS